jgi:hypothetical protein
LLLVFGFWLLAIVVNGIIKARKKSKEIAEENML